jgi:hypothetical protein
MRFTLPTHRPAPPSSPVPPRPRQPPSPAEGDLEESPQPIAGARRVTGRMAAAVAVVLLCAGVGMTTDVEMLRMGSGADQVSTAAPREADRAAEERAAADRATARKVAAAKAADAEAAAERAARARAAQVAAARRQVVAMPALVGLKLDVAMDVATDAGLTAVTVCRTPDGDTPLWWSNWLVTGQDVPAGSRIRVDRQVCVAATK